MTSARYRILALDGGGIKGTFTAAVLAEWEKETGLRVADHFDLIAGTSTGGILAIGLGLGLSAQELLDFYKKRGTLIFPVVGFRRRLLHTLRALLKPKHSGEVLEQHLKEAFGDKKLGHSAKRLVIPSYDTVRGRIFIFKTAHHERFKYDIDVPAWNIALATAAAPTYFQAATVPLHQDQGYVDGGVWANTPALAAVVEAMAFLGKRADEIDVLSIGTTYAPDSVKDLAGVGMLGWGTRVIKLLMNAQGEASHKQAMLLVGDANFMRVDCNTRPGDYAMDDASDINSLSAMGRGVAVEKLVLERVKRQFINGIHAAQFTPFHLPEK